MSSPATTRKVGHLEITLWPLPRSWRRPSFWAHNDGDWRLTVGVGKVEWFVDVEPVENGRGGA